jgi:hypothetical protein
VGVGVGKGSGLLGDHDEGLWTPGALLTDGGQAGCGRLRRRARQRESGVARRTGKRLGARGRQCPPLDTDPWSLVRPGGAVKLRRPVSGAA